MASLIVIVVALSSLSLVAADYDCICSEGSVVTVHDRPGNISELIGYILEYKCLPLLHDQLGEDDLYIEVLFENKSGYVANSSLVIEEICVSDLTDQDITTEAPLTTTTTTTLASTTTRPTTTTTTTTTTAPPPACDENWVLFENTCYYFHTMGNRVDWKEAFEACSRLGGHLASAEETTERYFLLQQLVIQPFDSHGVWLSGRYSSVLGWRWFSSDLISSTQIENIHVHVSLDNRRRAIWSRCLYIDTHNHYEWDDSSCSSNKQYVCEKSLPSTTTSAPTTTTTTTTTPTTTSAAAITSTITPSSPTRPNATTTTAAAATTTTTTSAAATETLQSTTLSFIPWNGPCPEGWMIYEDSCYMLSTTRAKWNDANRACYDTDSHLIIINDAAEDDFVVGELHKQIDVFEIGFDHISETGVWTAGNDRSLEGIWEWADPLSHIYAAMEDQEYSNWFLGQTPHGGDDENCLGLIGSFEYSWMDRPCNDEMFYICEKSVQTSSDMVLG